MATKPNRRDFMATTAVAGLAAAAAPLAASGPTMMRQSGVRPLVVTSENGFRFKNGGAKTCVETAFEKIAAGGDVLDAVIAGVNIVELDPQEDSVGYGGLPNADGIVQLDSAITRSTARLRSRSRSPRSCGTGSSPRSTWRRPRWS